MIWGQFTDSIIWSQWFKKLFGLFHHYMTSKHTAQIYGLLSRSFNRVSIWGFFTFGNSSPQISVETWSLCVWVAPFRTASTVLKETSVFVGLIRDRFAFKYQLSTFPPPVSRGSHENVSGFAWLMKTQPDFWHGIDSISHLGKISSSDHLIILKLPLACLFNSHLGHFDQFRDFSCHQALLIVTLKIRFGKSWRALICSDDEA